MVLLLCPLAFLFLPLAHFVSSSPFLSPFFPCNLRTSISLTGPILFWGLTLPHSTLHSFIRSRAFALCSNSFSYFGFLVQSQTNGLFPPALLLALPYAILPLLGSFLFLTVNRADQKTYEESNGRTRELDAVKKPLKNSLSDESAHSTGYNSDLKMELGSERAKNIDGNHATSPVKSDLSKQSKTSNINTGQIEGGDADEKGAGRKDEGAASAAAKTSSISHFNKWPSSDEFSSLQVKNIPSQSFKLTWPVILVTCIVISIALIALALARNMGSTVLLMSSWSFGFPSNPGYRSSTSFTAPSNISSSSPASHRRLLISSPSHSTLQSESAGCSSWWTRLGPSVLTSGTNPRRGEDEHSTSIELASSQQFTNSLCNKDLSSEEESEEQRGLRGAAAAAASLGEEEEKSSCDGSSEGKARQASSWRILLSSWRSGRSNIQPVRGTTKQWTSR